MEVQELDREQLAAAKAAVARGVALLDKVEPGWRSKMRREDFDIEDGYHCVLGQAFEDRITSVFGNVDESYYNGFDAGLQVLHLNPRASVEFGFSTSTYGDFGYPELGRAWEQELWPEMFSLTEEDVSRIIRQELVSVVKAVQKALS